MSWLSDGRLSGKIVSYPMIMLALGVLVYSFPLSLPSPDPLERESFILHLAELTVIISLMSTGLKISKSFSLRNYRIPLLLVFVTMICCILAVAVAGWWIADMALASAALLGAVFAPTDPVIADDVQVNFDETEERPLHFSLTAEAGINDGMAFPFTWFAIWIAAAGIGEWDWVGDWFVQDVIYRISIGIIAGFALGRAMAFTIFKLPAKGKLNPVRREFIVIAATFFIYGITELAEAYGFIAVFVAGIVIRHYEEQNDFNEEMYKLTDQIEKTLLAIVLVLFGGYAVTQMFEYLLWEHVAIVLLFIFIIRPVFGFIPLISSSINRKEKLMIAFMGMKGVGSFFYLAFALHKAQFAESEELWAITGFLVLTSVFVHGLTAYFIKIAKRRKTEDIL